MSEPTRPASLATGPATLGRGRSTGWWGTVLFIATEGALFVVLLTSYFYVRFLSGPEWPPGEIEKPSLTLVSIMTPILLLSSVPVHLAEVGIKRGRQWWLRLGLLAGTLMGGTFLGLQALEYHEVLTREFTARTNAYGTFFFAITGFHGLHVAVGLILLLWVQFFAWRGVFSERWHLPVETTVMYWHFVDAVWVLIFSSLYLAPYVWS